jgi:hypothetical protein
MQVETAPIRPIAGQKPGTAGRRAAGTPDGTA